MRLLVDTFDAALGTGMRVQDATGNIIVLPTVHSTQLTQGLQEMFIAGNAIVTSDKTPSRVTVRFQGGELTLDLPLRKEFDRL